MTKMKSVFRVCCIKSEKCWRCNAPVWRDDVNYCWECYKYEMFESR